MQKISKKIISALLIFVILFTAVPVVKTNAAEGPWISLGNNCHSLKGTDIMATIKNGIITITGHGELPDADYWKLYERPWHNSNCTNIVIGDGITSIGSYSFYGLDKIKIVAISSKTFIKDDTCFKGIGYMPYFRISGEEVTKSYFGTIPYSSLDSIIAFAQNYTNGASFILDNKQIAGDFQNSTHPTIRNVFVATDKKAPWNDLEEYANGNVATNIFRLSELNPVPSYVVSAQRRYQGTECYKAFTAFIGDYTYATAFNIVVQCDRKNVIHTDKTLLYTLTIPEEFRNNVRSFRLLAIGKGIVNIYDDLDANPSTITFATNEPTTAYALVYK